MTGHLSRRKVHCIAVASIAAGLILAACGSSKASNRGGRPEARGSGRVNVLYAGSLVNVMEKQVGPGFQADTGYSVTGYSGGSTALAAQIKGKVYVADVFISASPAVNASLEGEANGGWVSWYATFATSSLVLGYNPHSRFAQQLLTKPWYEVVTEPGFLLGRTDATIDPKGKLAVEALDNAATDSSQPALRALATSQSSVFPEETLVGRLQAGQLDAGFFYTSEAKAAGIATVPLTGQSLEATYTVTILNRAANLAGAVALVDYLLGPSGDAVLRADGFTVTTPPKITGSGLPLGVRSALGA